MTKESVVNVCVISDMTCLSVGRHHHHFMLKPREKNNENACNFCLSNTELEKLKKKSFSF